MIRVLIADDHAVVRLGLKQILTEDPEIIIKDDVSNGADALDKIRKNQYDILILDISMPGINGLDVLREVRSSSPDLPVLILSIHSEDQYAVRVLKDGASGYMTKEAAPSELINAVKSIISGHKYINSSIAEKLALYIETDKKIKGHELLSDREYYVFCKLASGISNKQIASVLGLSAKTISTYRTRILKKMGFETNAQLTHYAIKEHLL